MSRFFQDTTKMLNERCLTVRITSVGMNLVTYDGLRLRSKLKTATTHNVALRQVKSKGN
jgi:hypothetical protein